MIIISVLVKFRFFLVKHYGNVCTASFPIRFTKEITRLHKNAS